MFIETVPNRTSAPAVPLRESDRDEQGRAQKRTLANLGKLPGSLIEGLKGSAQGRHSDRHRSDDIQIERSLPHGHVAAALGMLRKIALDRLITPRSKLGFVRAVDQETATSRLGAVLRLGEVRERETPRQASIHALPKPTQL